MEKKSTPFKHFIENTLQGLFWVLPMAAVVIIVLWIYDKINMLVNYVFNFVGFAPQHNEFFWGVGVVSLFIILLYIVGHFMETRIGNVFESLFSKIPGYNTIKDIIGIFNSSKKGETKVLVVAVKGFGSQGYNIGLMYSQTESIIKDHFTVTLSQTPIPNGGYMFEIHKESIFVIEEASFDDNLQYLLSMGVKSMTEILDLEPKEELLPLSKWLEQRV